MCGIVAVLSSSVPISENLLVHMRDQLIHRGPDSSGLWLDRERRIGLAHRRLSIIDVGPQSDQPFASHDGVFQLVFNGEIYNYIELRQQLARLGVRFETQSDTEVLLKALIEWGEAALPRLNGMFSFAFWDSTRKELLLARDRFGEKPLFIGRGSLNTVVVASEMKAILAHNLIPTTTSGCALKRYGAGLWREDDEETFFENIKRIPPAHLVVLDQYGREVRRRRYWTPDYSNVTELRDPNEVVEEFAFLFAKSVRLRMRSDVSIGSSLSGGLDSSVVVAELAGHRENRHFSQNTFTACFPDDPTLSEENDVSLVAASTGVKSHKIAPSPKTLMDESLKLHWYQEEPFMSASIFLQWCVSRLAKEHDTTVMLDGQGADELLAGYQSFFNLWQHDLLDLGRIEKAKSETMLFQSRLAEVAKRFSDVDRRFNPAVAHSVEELDSLIGNSPDVWSNDYGPGTAEAKPGNRMLRVLSETLLYNGLPMLLRYADRNSMAFSRENRLPYLDYELADFCISLPPQFLIRDGWQKWPLRKYADRVLPSRVAWRADKVGYAAPLDNWLREELHDWAKERVFDPSTIALCGYDHDHVTALWSNHMNGSANNSWAIWQWISIAEWSELTRCGYWGVGFA